MAASLFLNMGLAPCGLTGIRLAAMLHLALAHGAEYMATFINFSQPAENNQAPILARLRLLFAEPATVLEIGSGSGQHAVAFASALPHLTWQPSDQGSYLEGLRENLAALAPANVRAAATLDLSVEPWPVSGIDHIYAANVVHIAPQDVLSPLFRGAAQLLPATGLVCLYGPYKYGGEFTTPSNERFDGWLKSRDLRSGIRDIEVVTGIAQEHGFALRDDYSMPANNQLLVFGRVAAS